MKKVFFILSLCAMVMHAGNVFSNVISTQQAVLVTESDTIDFGRQEKSEVPLLEHILVKNCSQSDVRITAIEISNNHAKVSASPVIVAGTRGTIVCIIDKKSLPLGSHVDMISIKTDNAKMPEASLYIKYEIIANH